MDAERREMYWAGITVIEAQNSLIAMNVAAYPQMKKEDAKKFHRKMHELAYPQSHNFDLSAPIDTEALAKRLGGLING